MLKGETIPLYGKGDTRRDYTFVGDIVSGVRAALDYDREKYAIINLGCGRTISLDDMVSALEEVLGVRAKVERQPEQPGDVRQTWADIDTAREALGYAPSTSLIEGMGAFRDWLSETGDLK
jgi:UDP-glucuronate 4-epimerase